MFGAYHKEWLMALMLHRTSITYIILYLQKA
jgi:hypothetical protein